MRLPEVKEGPDLQPSAQGIADLERRLLEALDRIAQLEAENACLQQQLAAARKDSSTSSKPPSSDIVKPKKPLAQGRQEAEEGRTAGT